MATTYNIPIESFECSELLLRINASHWGRVGWLTPKKEDTINVIGKTRRIKFIYSSDGGLPLSLMYFRPEEYFNPITEAPSDDPILRHAMIQIDLNK